MITLTIFLSKIPTFTAKSVLKMKGDDFNIIYERNYRRSFLFTKSYVHDDMVAEDIVAESLVKYWRLVSAGENEITEALLLTILKNKALNYLRHKAIHDAAIENLEEIKNRELSIRISTLEACDPKEIFSDEVNRIIHKTLKNLPEQTHPLFLLRFYSRSGSSRRCGASVRADGRALRRTDATTRNRDRSRGIRNVRRSARSTAGGRAAGPADGRCGRTPCCGRS